MKTLFRTILLLAMSLATTRARAEEEKLYLHCFRQTSNQQVAVDENAARNRTPEIPPAALVTLKVNPGESFEVAVGDRTTGLSDEFTGDNPDPKKMFPFNGVSGTVTRDGDTFAITLEGHFGSSRHRFNGPIELEKPFDPEMKFSASAVIPFRCVLSRSKDIRPFLRAQAVIDAKRLEEVTELSKKNQELERAKQRNDKPAD